MPVYSSIRPVKILINNLDYTDEHLTYFFNTYSLNAFDLMTQQKKERVFEMLTKHENLLTKFYGNALLQSAVFVPKLARDNVDNVYVKEYKKWLEKQ
jgi:hypothetical protein